MRPTPCGSCGQQVFFADLRCLRCGSDLAYRPSTNQVVVAPDAGPWCANRSTIGCNWLVEDVEPDNHCRSCRLTRTIPPRDDDAAMEQWGIAEEAKRRVVAQLFGLGVSLAGVTFDLESSAHGSVVIGHADGVISMDVGEADDAQRVANREDLGEDYRTVIGHFRHEIGHFLHQGLVVDRGRSEAFRQLFGDPTVSYEDALERHYEQGPPAGWEQEYISPYATMHPHEDWAESLAHYLHVRAVLDTASGYGLRVDDIAGLAVNRDRTDPFEAIVASWLPLAFAMNAITRAMGQDDLYPFVLTRRVLEKLRFVHDGIVGG